MNAIKKLLQRITGIQQLLDKTNGLYYKTEADKQQIIQKMERLQEEARFVAGQSLAAQIKALTSISRLHEVEFKVFSQFGEDGIIQWLIHQLPDIPETFIEFGVENYKEANTRFLLMHNAWRGLIIDGSTAHIQQVQQEEIYWKYDLTAVAAFITRDNINTLIEQAGFGGDIGLLSIDIDGNDYWVWEAIQTVQPWIVVAEYNANFGAERAITIPYQADFYRSTAHHSNIYFGASLPALCHLAEQKGYELVGCTKAGNNAFFIKKGVWPTDKPKFWQGLTSEQLFQPGISREERDESGKLTFADAAKRRATLVGLPVVNVKTGGMETL